MGRYNHPAGAHDDRKAKKEQPVPWEKKGKHQGEGKRRGGMARRKRGFLVGGRKKVKPIEIALKEDFGSKTAHDPFQEGRQDS